MKKLLFQEKVRMILILSIVFPVVIIGGLWYLVKQVSKTTWKLLKDVFTERIKNERDNPPDNTYPMW